LLEELFPPPTAEPVEPSLPEGVQQESDSPAVKQEDAPAGGERPVDPPTADAQSQG
jgi:hypothetical protein